MEKHAAERTVELLIHPVQEAPDLLAYQAIRGAGSAVLGRGGPFCQGIDRIGDTACQAVLKFGERQENAHYLATLYSTQPVDDLLVPGAVLHRAVAYDGAGPEGIDRRLTKAPGLTTPPGCCGAIPFRFTSAIARVV